MEQDVLMDEDSHIEAFESWFRNIISNHETSTENQLLCIKYDQFTKLRGLFSLTKLSEGNCCLTIPLDDLRLIFTPVRCLCLLLACGCLTEPSQLPTFTESADILVLFMYHVKYPLLPSCMLSKIWLPYISTLPKTYSDPMFGMFSNQRFYDELCKCFENFASQDVQFHFDRVKFRLLQAWNRLRNFLTCMYNNNHHIGNPSNEFLWAWCTVNSRCVYCPFKESFRTADLESIFNKCLSLMRIPRKPIAFPSINLVSSHVTVALLPYFDFLNHDPRVSATLERGYESNSLQLILKQTVPEGNQVFINYGPHDNLVLLTEYGFVLPFGTNPHDAIYPSLNDLLDLTKIMIHNLKSITTDEPHYTAKEEHICSVLRQIISTLQPTHRNSKGSSIWQSICLTEDGLSYHLNLLLFAVHKSIMDKPDEIMVSPLSEDLSKMYEISEDLMNPITSKWAPHLISNLCKQTQADSDLVRELYLKMTPNLNNDSFLHQLSLYFEQRKKLLELIKELF